MALILDTGTCKHCHKRITKARYASGNWDRSIHNLDLWVHGSTAFPGDGRFCEVNLLDDDIGSYGNHEPIVEGVTERCAHNIEPNNCASCLQASRQGHTPNRPPLQRRVPQAQNPTAVTTYPIPT